MLDETIGFDLDQLLADQLEPSESAEVKATRVRLPSPDAWALKLVQAAVGWGAKSIRIRQTVSSTTFFFRPKVLSAFPSEHQIIRHVLEGDFCGEEPLERLALVLRTLAERAGYSFLLCVRDGDNEVRPLYSGSEILASSKREPPYCATEDLTGVMLMVSHLCDGERYKGPYFPRSLLKVRKDLDFALELEKNAFVCPIPIFLDGRLLNQIFQHPKFGFSRAHRPLLVAGVSRNPEEEALPLSVCGEQKVMSYLTDPRRASRLYDGDKDFSSWYLCRGIEPDQLEQVDIEPKQRVHEILWVCDGVLVYREGVEIPTSLLLVTIFLNARGLPTDLTGLQLTESFERDQRARGALKDIAAQMTECALNVDAFFQPDRDKYSTADDEIRTLRRNQSRTKRLLLSILPPFLRTSASPFIGAISTLTNTIALYRHDHLYQRQLLAEKSDTMKWRLEGDFDRLCQILDQPRTPIFRPS
jgi:hypothetical protein